MNALLLIVLWAVLLPLSYALVCWIGRIHQNPGRIHQNPGRIHQNPGRPSRSRRAGTH
jgi:hypothetical protein